MLPHVEDHSSSFDVSSHLAIVALWFETGGLSCRPSCHSFEDGQKALQLYSANSEQDRGGRLRISILPLPFPTSSRAGWENFDLWTKSGSLSVFANKLLFAHNHITKVAALSSYNWEQHGPQSKDAYKWPFTKKCADSCPRASWISLVLELQLAWLAKDLHEAMFQNTLLRD